MTIEFNKCCNCMYGALSNGAGYCMLRSNNKRIIFPWGSCEKHVDDDDRAEVKSNGEKQ